MLAERPVNSWKMPVFGSFTTTGTEQNYVSWSNEHMQPCALFQGPLSGISNESLWSMSLGSSPLSLVTWLEQCRDMYFLNKRHRKVIVTDVWAVNRIDGFMDTPSVVT
jgi:hypothetical protein